MVALVCIPTRTIDLHVVDPLTQLPCTAYIVLTKELQIYTALYCTIISKLVIIAIFYGHHFLHSLNLTMIFETYFL